MLIGHITENTMTSSYPSIINKVLGEVNKLDLGSLALGRHYFKQMDADKIWFVILEYQKSALSDLQPEVHKYHSDLQIILSGKERMAWSLDTGTHEMNGNYNSERDILFYKYEGVNLNYIDAVPGTFYLFTPNVIHITNIQDDNNAMVRKLVVKIHNDLLGK